MKKELEVTRRKALKGMLTAGLGTVALPSWVLSLSERAVKHAELSKTAAAYQDGDEWSPRFLNHQQNEMVIIISEMIIPETDTPGARGAKVNQFIDTVLAESDPPEQENFLQGLSWVESRSQELFGDTFGALSKDAQTALLTRMSSTSESPAVDQTGAAFFSAIKALTITGYYTSEIGYFQELGNDGQMFFEDYLGSQEPEAVIKEWLEESRALQRASQGQSEDER